MKKLCLLFLFPMLLSGCIDLGVNYHRLLKPRPVSKYPQSAIYLMRGGLGGIFSKGMNYLEDTLEDTYKIPATSTVWYKSSNVTKKLVEAYEKNPKIIIILGGHSLGANAQIKVANTLKKQNIPVALLITVDPVLPATIPANVRYAINIYKPSFVPLLSGLRVEADNPKNTKVENINIENLRTSVNHLTIDKNPKIQEIMVQAILATVKSKEVNGT